MMDLFSVDNKKIRLGITRTVDISLIHPIQSILGNLDEVEFLSNYKFISKQLLQMMNRQQVDLAIVGENKSQHTDMFRFDFLHREKLMVAIPSKHPASHKRCVDLRDIAELPLFWFPRNVNPDYFDKCEAYFQSLPFILKRKNEPEDSLLMLTNISKGEGFALMPESMCSAIREGMCYKPLDPNSCDHLNIDIYLAIHKDEKRERVLKLFDKLKMLQINNR